MSNFIQLMFTCFVVCSLSVSVGLGLGLGEDIATASNETIADEGVKKAKKKNDARPLLAQPRRDVENSKALITEIKSQPPFVHLEKEKVWRFKNFDENDFELNENPDLRWLSQVIRVVSLLVEASLWLAIVVVVFLVYRYREYWLNLIQGKRIARNRSHLPSTLFGLDLREENLPHNIEQTSQQFWQSQQYRDAVSLLYRGALANLFKQLEFNLPSGSTEHDCLRYIEQCSNHSLESSSKHPPLSESKLQAFSLLTEVWVEVAYAHVYPQNSVFQQLCADWHLHFSDSQAVS